jgi:hypothetical protein
MLCPVAVDDAAHLGQTDAGAFKSIGPVQSLTELRKSPSGRSSGDPVLGS